MSLEKNKLRERFSSDPDKYYRVALFTERGFVRKHCTSCGQYFWTLDSSRERCNEQPCEKYSFLGNPGTPEPYTFAAAWKKAESFFKKNGHHILARYPVVCRWRPDLYFTIASIVDFQRIEGGKVVFEFPYNPVLVPQMCLRFVDVANVGITGRHGTSFCMVGQQALSNPQGYWKDRCIQLDFDLLTREFGIDEKDIVFKEDVWLGPGAFGYSLEYTVQGLEMGNAVFTAFEGTPDHYEEYKEKVVDMGAGLERWAWLSRGSPTMYDAVYPSVLAKLRTNCETKLPDQDFLKRYFTVAGSLNAEEFGGGIDSAAKTFSKILHLPEEDLREKASYLQALYSIADHTRTILFATADGALPSNVGGGYNLRVLLRRALDFADRLKLKVGLADVALWHTEELRDMYPELLEHDDDVRIIFDAEMKKYQSTKARAAATLDSFAKRKQEISEQKMIELYDSDGISPEMIVQRGLAPSVPANFYSAVLNRHLKDVELQETGAVNKAAKGKQFDLRGIEPTQLLFYLNRDLFEFEAKVLRILEGEYAILDETAFYARAGGQEPDHGTINGLAVIDAVKQENIVVHRIEGLASSGLKEGDTVRGVVDQSRRSKIMRHHTATHIVNGAARRIIGPWVWQHSAFKDQDMARLDITHFAHLSREQVLQIERLSNQIVRENRKVSIEWMPRAEAEQSFGFRIYQGGVAPTKDLRIVSIADWDVEACGGTHCSSTGEVGMIKIIKSERVQDGVERLEFVAGEPAVEYVEKQESLLLDTSSLVGSSLEKLASTVSRLKSNEEGSRRAAKQLSAKLADMEVRQMSELGERITEDIRFVSSVGELDPDYYFAVGERASKTIPSIVYVALFPQNGRTRILVFSGQKAQVAGLTASSVLKKITSELGGSGGGDSKFGQGGFDRLLTDPKIDARLSSIVRSMISSKE